MDHGAQTRSWPERLWYAPQGVDADSEFPVCARGLIVDCPKAGERGQVGHQTRSPASPSKEPASRSALARPLPDPEP